MGICVVDIGNTNIKFAVFNEDKLQIFQSFSAQNADLKQLKTFLLDQRISEAFIGSVNQKALYQISTLFEELHIPYSLLKKDLIPLVFNVKEPLLLGHDRIANVFGALKHFPSNDCLIVDIGTAVNFDLVAKEGKFLGGAIYPGVSLSAKALTSFTDQLPLIHICKPQSAIGKDTESDIRSGIYYGLLGAIERICSEITLAMPSPSSIKILATGGAFRLGEGNSEENLKNFSQDLLDLVDIIDPYLTLIGLYEIYKETKLKKQEKE